MVTAVAAPTGSDHLFFFSLPCGARRIANRRRISCGTPIANINRIHRLLSVAILLYCSSSLDVVAGASNRNVIVTPPSTLPSASSSLRSKFARRRALGRESDQPQIPRGGGGGGSTTSGSGKRSSDHDRHPETSLPHGDTVVLPRLRAGSEEGVATTGLVQRLKVTFYFGLWYALNVIFNILNKKLLNVVPAPLTIGCLQLWVGTLFSATMWLSGLRARPTLKGKLGWRSVARVGLYHSSGQLLSQMSLGAGPVSFTHIVKALEPLFSAVVSALLFGKWMSWSVYASLLPVVGGVAYACLKERYFSWLAFHSAMGSNLAFAFRAAESKRVMSNKDKMGTNLTSANTFSLVTIYAAVLSLPVWLVDGGVLVDAWKSIVSTSDPVSVSFQNQRDLAWAVMVSGLFHYLNNEVMYLALGNVHPVTLAVGNTMKRVFIMVASVMVFRNPISLQAGIGSAVGIAGVLLYSLAKQRYETIQATK